LYRLCALPSLGDALPHQSRPIAELGGDGSGDRPLVEGADPPQPLEPGQLLGDRLPATLLDVLNFYDLRFNLGVSEQQKGELVAFLRTL
jgi:hypothetical protein